MKTSLTLLCLLVLMLPQSLRAQVAAATWSVHYPNLPLSQVLEDYQEWTGKHIVRDPRIENVNVTIETAGTLSKEQAIEFVEKSLLLAGYAFVPSGDNMVKIVAFAAGGSPVSEHVEMVLLEDELPKTDKIVSYLLRLNYLKADEAAQAFAQIVPNHPYGKITAVPNARALVITENSNTIRAYLDLARQVDVPPGETRPKTIQLVRADAEEVAKALNELLGLNSPSATTTLKAAAITPPKPTNPQQAAAAAAAQVVHTATVGGNEGETAAPKIQAISRTNSLIVIARPLDIEYIESLVKEFDAVAGTRGFISRKFRYMDVIEFANVAKDALLRGSKESSAAKLENPTDNKTTTTNTSVTIAGTGGQNFGGGYSGGPGGGSGGGSTLGGGLQESQIAKTQSMVIGKTLLIVEPTNSRIFASGPPEQLALLQQLATELDKRPQQIRISAIIGEFTLGDDFQFGLDWVRAMENLANGNAIGGTSNSTGNKPVDFLSFGKLTDFPAPQGLAVYGHLGKYLNGFLTTLESTKRFHVLQRPNVSTLNHKLATISTGQQLAIPGQTLTTATNSNIVNSSASVVSTTQYIPVELRLDIIPHIYANDEVRLEFSQQNYDVSGFTLISGNKVPNISTQSLKNNIIVPSGTSVLLGGLITERDTNSKNGLPLLSRIPVVKHLFTSTTKSKERRELLIFVMPEVLPGGEDLVESQNEILKQTQSYPITRKFTDPAEAQNIAAPRAMRVSDEEAPAMNHIDLSTRFVSPPAHR